MWEWVREIEMAVAKGLKGQVEGKSFPAYP